MSSFANLKRNSSSFDKLTKALESTNQPAESGSKEDVRFWQPSVDKVGNGMASIRFLPAPSVDGDDALPWVRVFSHGFQGPGGWFIDNCLTTLNGKCPVCEHNSTLWNSGIEANKEIVRKQKRKLSYISNIYVISDPSNPDNDGTVRLFRFGKKIFDKITETMNPEFPDEKPVNPFDMWEGANFKMKIRNVEGYRNYDKSEFSEKSPLLSGDDDQLEAIWKKQFSLKEFTSETNFKPYDVLKLRLDKVLGFDGLPSVPMIKAEDVVLRKFTDEEIKILDKNPSDDGDLDYFRGLANDK
jgi:hypothetical protein